MATLKPKQVATFTEIRSHSVLRQLATLETMTLEQLHEQWRDLYGGEPPHYKRQFLIKRLAYRIQELFYGGLSEAAKTRLRQVARDDSAARVESRTSGVPQGQADILPGTRFVRIWKDRRYEVLAHENGFEYDPSTSSFNSFEGSSFRMIRIQHIHRPGAEDRFIPAPAGNGSDP